jgi:hypothetical protein
MATYKVKKLASGASDISGLKTSRYEKLQVAYGAISDTAYALNDTLVFHDVPSKDIIRATVVAHATVPITLEVFPATNVTGSPFTLTLSTGQAACKISYVIEYIRGNGKVGIGAGPSDGELFAVTIVAGAQAIPATREEQIPAAS